MIVFSSLQIRRGVRVLLDNATATINPGQKVGLVGKNGCGKSTLLSLLKNEISADGGSMTFPGNWQLAWVNQETPALPQPAIDYVIDGDREYRQLEADLKLANERNDGHAIATVYYVNRPPPLAQPLSIVFTLRDKLGSLGGAVKQRQRGDLLR